MRYRPDASIEDPARIDPEELAAILIEVRRAIRAADAGTGARRPSPAVDADTGYHRPLRDIILHPADKAGAVAGDWRGRAAPVAYPPPSNCDICRASQSGHIPWVNRASVWAAT